MAKIRGFILLIILSILLALSPAYATISTTASQSTLLGNGATTVFNFPFVADTESNISVIYTNSSGVETTLQPSQYSVFLNPPSPGQLWGVGGSVTYPLSGSPIASGTSLTIQRILPLQQTTDITNQGDFYPQVVESALDTLVMQVQQVSGRTGLFRGTWIGSSVYNYGDIVQDGVNGSNSSNYYMCIQANTSTLWSSDLSSGDWQLIITSAFPTTSLPLSIVNGGTGQSSAAAALAALGGVSLSGTNAFVGANTFIGGSIAVPTRSPGDSTTNAASTAFVNGTALTLANGTTATTQAASDNTTKVATTAQVQAAIALSAVGSPQNWTPILGFGGGSIGLTYGTRSGKYIQIGKFIFAEWNITLTSKGSSTGNATITGLVVPALSSGFGQASATVYSNMTSITQPFTFAVTPAFFGVTAVLLTTSDGSTGQGSLTDANFTNTTTLNGSAIYIAN